MLSRDLRILKYELIDLIVRYLPRILENELRRAVRQFPALIVTGPRRAGKTTLLRRMFPHAQYMLLEDPDMVGRASADPRGFLDERRLPVILDEVQNVPALFSYIRARIDAAPRRAGQWLLTGAQDVALMRGATESMAGRAAVFQLFPFSAAESNKVSLLRGGFPEPLARPGTADIWFRSYVQTYLERDVRSISSIRDLATFRRFLAVLASRCGQVLNKTDLAAPLGVTVPTISGWLGILEITGQVLLIPPFYESFGKRLLKSPKLHFVDSGLACHLLGITSSRALASSPFLGPLFEGFVAAEIVKNRLNRGRDRGLYYFRDQQGLEVDFVLDQGNGHLALVEAKATRTPMPDDARSLRRLARSIGGYTSSAYLVHNAQGAMADPAALSPGVKALAWSRLGDALFS